MASADETNAGTVTFESNFAVQDCSNTALYSVPAACPSRLVCGSASLEANVAFAPAWTDFAPFDDSVSVTDMVWVRNRHTNPVKTTLISDACTDLGQPDTSFCAAGVEFGHGEFHFGLSDGTWLKVVAAVYPSADVNVLSWSDVALVN
jgi:hypothetical protein